MRDNMIVNMSGHAEKSTGIDMEIEHLIRLDKVCTVIETRHYTKHNSSICFSFVESMQTGTVSATSQQSVPSCPSSRSVAAQNLNQDTLDPRTLALTPAATSGWSLRRLAIRG